MKRRPLATPNPFPAPGEETTPAPPPAVEDDLAQSFFQAGLSEDEITAASERQRDRESLHRAHAPTNRWVYAVAGVAACGVVGFVLSHRHSVQGEGAREHAPAVIAASPAPAAPTAAPAVTPPPAAEPAKQAPAEPAAEQTAATAVPAPAPEVPAAASAATPKTLTNAAAPITNLARANDQAPAAAAIPAHKTVAVAELRTGSAPPASAADVMAQEAPAVTASGSLDVRGACTESLRAGRAAEVKAVCTKAFAVAPSAELAIQIARSALEHEHFSDAQTWAKKALGLEGRNAEAFLTLGGAEQGLGHAADARAAYGKYLEIAPTGALADEVRAIIEQL